MINRIKVIVILLLTVFLIIFQVINRQDTKTNQKNIIPTSTLSPINKESYKNNEVLKITPINQEENELIIKNPPYDEFGERTDGGWTDDIDFSLPE